MSRRESFTKSPYELQRLLDSQPWPPAIHEALRREILEAWEQMQMTEAERQVALIVSRSLMEWHQSLRVLRDAKRPELAEKLAVILLVAEKELETQFPGGAK